MDLQTIREQQHLTQEALAEKSGISVRTIQRIEAGTEPKGHTRRSLLEALGLTEADVQPKPTPVAPPAPPQVEVNTTWIKVMNASSLLVAFLPFVSALPPLLILLIRKDYSALAKQIFTLQIIWSVGAVVVFFTATFVKKGLDLSNNFTFLIMVLLVVSNLFIILRNAAAIDRKKALAVKPPFTLF